MDGELWARSGRLCWLVLSRQRLNTLEPQSQAAATGVVLTSCRMVCQNTGAFWRVFSVTALCLIHTLSSLPSEFPPFPLGEVKTLTIAYWTLDRGPWFDSQSGQKNLQRPHQFSIAMWNKGGPSIESLLWGTQVQAESLHWETLAEMNSVGQFLHLSWQPI